MKYESNTNTSKKITLTNNLILDKNQSNHQWRAKWINGVLTYPKDIPYTKTDKAIS